MNTFLAFVYAFNNAVKFFIAVKKRLDEGETIKQIKESHDLIDEAFKTSDITEASRILNDMWMRNDSANSAQAGVDSNTKQENGD